MTVQNPANLGIPPFAEAVATFRGFLGELAAPTNVRWITREDVTSHGRRFWVRRGDAEESLRVAEAWYEHGCRKGLGISLRAVCKVGASTACYVWVPQDETAASYAMQPRSLKCQVPVPLPTAIEVRSFFYWHLRRAINGCRKFGNALVSELPVRAVTAS